MLFLCHLLYLNELFIYFVQLSVNLSLKGIEEVRVNESML